MGNKNCIADGGTPHMIRIQLKNRSPFTLALDPDARCGRECNHAGLCVEQGKFVQGYAPIEEIRPQTNHEIRVSGRENTALVPVGWFQYNLRDPSGSYTNCKAKIRYTGAGWTSFQNKTMVACDLIGSPPNFNSEALSRVVSETQERFYTVEFSMGGSNVIKAGKEPVNWEQHVAAAFRPTSASRCNGVRVLIYDRTPSTKACAKSRGQRVDIAWWVGSGVGAFDLVVPSTADDGFEAALQKVVSGLGRDTVIGELQFWCHGSPGGGVKCGDSDLEPASLACLAPFTRSHSRIWFRTCSTLAESSDLAGCSPGPRAAEFAAAVCAAGGFGVVAGHTVPIGSGRHSNLYALASGSGAAAWLGPAEDEGRADDALHHYFPSLA